MSLIIKTTGIEDYLDSGQANIKALIMGAPSAGKTRSASFWPKPIFADCEKGRMSIADRNVPYAEILSLDDMDSLLRMLQQECTKPHANRKYQTLVIDTVDAYQRLVIQKRLTDERKEALAGWGDWGYLDAKMNQFVAKLHSLPMNIVINLHTKTSTTGDDDNKQETIGPKLKGDMKEQIAAEFDLVGHMGTYWEAEDGERMLKRGIEWWPSPQKPILKDRSGQLPKWTPVTFSDQDFSDLFGMLTGHLDGLKPSEELEVVASEVAEPVPPMKGGPVANAPLQPAATPRKTAASKTEKAAEPAPAAPASATPTAPVVPTAVGVPAATRPTIPAAAKPEISGATSVPEQAATPEPVASTESPAVAAESPAEPEQTLEQATEAAQESLGGVVISETQAADVVAPEQEAASVAQVSAPVGQPLCGTSSNEGEEGQPGSVAGCGNPVDPEDDMTQIAMFKTRTYLCPADFAAWRATQKK